jgi:hypothetical protein
MATSVTITATSQEIDLPLQQEEVTIYNTGSYSIYGISERTPSSFAGTGAQLAALADFEIPADGILTLKQAGRSVHLVCATGETSSVNISAGRLRPFDSTTEGIVVRPELQADMAGILLEQGELAYESDTGVLKVGDGERPGGRSVAGWDSTNALVVRAIGTARENGEHLREVVEMGGQLTPNGLAISSTNRAEILVGHGLWDLGDQPIRLTIPGLDIKGFDRDKVKLTCSDSCLILGYDTDYPLTDVVVEDLTIETTSSDATKAALTMFSHATEGATLRRLRLRATTAAPISAVTFVGSIYGLIAEDLNGDPAPIFSGATVKGYYEDLNVGDNSFSTIQYGTIKNSVLGAGSCANVTYGTFENITVGDGGFDTVLAATLKDILGGANSMASVTWSRVYRCETSGNGFTTTTNSKFFSCIHGDASYSGNL